MSAEVWQRLVEGKPLGAGVPKIDGRYDFRNLRIAEPRPVETMQMGPLRLLSSSHRRDVLVAGRPRAPQRFAFGEGVKWGAICNT